ncbi:hypothetical protein Tco_1303660 [Tanacetum coccineum]
MTRHSPVIYFDETPFGDVTNCFPAETPTIPSIVPTLPYTSPFLYTDSSDSDTYERPPSQDPYEVIVARWRSRVAARSSPLSSPTHDSSPADVTPPTRHILLAPPNLPSRPSILVLPGQPIPVGQPYRTQHNEVRKMLTTRKSVRPLPSHRLALRYSESHSPSDHFSLDNFASDTLSGSSSGYLSDTSSGRSIPDSSFGTPAASIEGTSRKRYRSPAVSVPLATLVPRVLSPVRTDLLPPGKRTKGYIPAFDRDGSAESSYETYTEPDIDSDVHADIDDDTEAAAAREADIKVEMMRVLGRNNNLGSEVDSLPGLELVVLTLGSIRDAVEAIGARLEEVYVPEWHGGPRVVDMNVGLSSLRGEVASAHDQNVIFEQECTSLQLKVAGLESIIAGKDQELYGLRLRLLPFCGLENQSLLDQVHKLELSSADLRLKLETYEGVLASFGGNFNDNLNGNLSG